MQSRKHSFFEACLGTFIGFFVALLGQIFIFPFFGIYTNMLDNILIAVFFTIISIVRSYAVRRLFNFLHIKGIL